MQSLLEYTEVKIQFGEVQCGQVHVEILSPGVINHLAQGGKVGVCAESLPKSVLAVVEQVLESDVVVQTTIYYSLHHLS